ncbi:MAG: hypothetical protein JNK48_30750 [Bryobacterales bacterium]|nr:hypothetical protein [Bryobacterales bacterium]
MKLAKYWARGPAPFHCRGWSDESEAGARKKAEEIGRIVSQRIDSGRPREGYLYGDRPLPEPVLERLPGGLITRNAYGAAVLNCEWLLFLDVDREEATATPAALDLLSGLRSLFGKPAPAPSRQSPVEASMEAVASRHGLSLRIYRTAAGYRGVVTNLRFHAASEETRKILHEFACDPLYVRLCRAQESFRARLTPKPWRCGLEPPPASYPYADDQAEAGFRAWLRDYQDNSRANAVCRFVRSVGAAAMDAETARLIERHDHETKAHSQLPLA